MYYVPFSDPIPFEEDERWDVDISFYRYVVGSCFLIDEVYVMQIVYDQLISNLTISFGGTDKAVAFLLSNKQVLLASLLPHGLITLLCTMFHSCFYALFSGG
jgi:hypothetical protein